MDRRQFMSGGAASAGIAAGSRNSPSPAQLSAALKQTASGAFSDWTERAAFSAYGRNWRALEDLRSPHGSLAFVTESGAALVLDRRLEPVSDQAKTPYLGLDLKAVALAGPDLLADRLLAGGDDPAPLAVRDAAPPPASNFKPGEIGARLPWTFFLGTRQQGDTMPVTTKGSTRTFHVDQVFAALGSDSALVARRLEGLLGSGAPALVKIFPLDTRRYYEVLAFGDTEAHDSLIVQTWHRTSLIEDGRAKEVAYAHSYPSYPPMRGQQNPAAFYEALLAFAFAWETELADMAEIELPDSSWRDMVRHAFAKELMTRPGGDYPKYGAVDRDYFGTEYDGFQDTFTSSLYANLEWGRYDQARRVLDNYFTQFVTPNGDINMRGPETAQFGLTLMLLARYASLTGDTATVLRHAGKIRATAAILTALHDSALALPKSDPGHGLLHGWNESDSCLFPDPSIWWKPYFANSAFAARGLQALADVWPTLQPQDRALCQDWAFRARQLRERVNVAVRKSVRLDLHPPYVPPLPGATLTFRESLAQETPSPQQWPHRAYCELLQPDILSPDLANLVIDAMRGHGATSIGVVANIGPPTSDARDILGFISYGYARQLLQRGRIEEYLLFLYTHRYHAHTPGSWTAGEVCDITGGLPLFCIPAQLTIPLLVRWMLVFEEDDAQRLHLARATPRSWLASGQTLAIRDAPTRWGPLDFSLRLDKRGGQLTGRIELKGRVRPEETHLRLRLPKGAELKEMTVNGLAATLIDETLVLASRTNSKFEVRAVYAG